MYLIDTFWQQAKTFATTCLLLTVVVVNVVVVVVHCLACLLINKYKSLGDMDETKPHLAV